MSDQIQVNSFRVLENLESAISIFSSRFSEVLRDAEREIERKRHLVDGAVQERKRAVSYWQREYDSADPEEDDIGYISRRLEEAEAELREGKRWQQRIDESFRDYSQRASRAAYFMHGRYSEGRGDLTPKDCGTT